MTWHDACRIRSGSLHNESVTASSLPPRVSLEPKHHPCYVRAQLLRGALAARAGREVRREDDGGGAHVRIWSVDEVRSQRSVTAAVFWVARRGREDDARALLKAALKSSEKVGSRSRAAPPHNTASGAAAAAASSSDDGASLHRCAQADALAALGTLCAISSTSTIDEVRGGGVVMVCHDAS